MPAVVPASFRGAYSDLLPVLELGRQYLETRLLAELRELRPVKIEARVKDVASAYSKIQKGEYGRLRDVDDLIAARAIFLHPEDVASALVTARIVFPVVAEKNTVAGKPTDFSYRQPHLVVKFPGEYLARHADLSPLCAELQFTTYVQHALQESVHDIIYKGRRFSWREHRLDGRLRGLLEIVDEVLENLASVAGAGKEPSYGLFDHRNEIIDECSDIWSPEQLPDDLRRFAITVEGMLKAANATVRELRSFAENHPDLVSALSLNAVDKILGLLLLERFDQFVSGLGSRKVFVPAELEAFVPDLSRFPVNKRLPLSE